MAHPHLRCRSHGHPPCLGVTPDHIAPVVISLNASTRPLDGPSPSPLSLLCCLSPRIFLPCVWCYYLRILSLSPYCYVSALLTYAPFLLTFRLECMTQPTSTFLCVLALSVSLISCLCVCLALHCVVFIAFLGCSLLCVSTSSYSMLCILLLLLFPYCCESASISSVLCLLLTCRFLGYSLLLHVCLALLVATTGLSRIVCFFGRSDGVMIGKLCQSCR